MDKVFLLCAAHHYEFSQPVLAFTSEAEARSVCKAANDYLPSRPAYPEWSEDAPEDEFDRLIAEHEATDALWGSKHPLAGCGDLSPDEYCVSEVPLRSTRATSGTVAVGREEGQ